MLCDLSPSPGLFSKGKNSLDLLDNHCQAIALLILLVKWTDLGVISPDWSDSFLHAVPQVIIPLENSRHNIKRGVVWILLGRLLYPL